MKLLAFCTIYSLNANHVSEYPNHLLGIRNSAQTRVGKVIVSAFVDAQRLVSSKYNPKMLTMMHTDILRRIRDAVKCKRPVNWTWHSWFPLHNNALAFRCLAQLSVTALEHPKYSSH
jgi:hypothetical protein